MLAPGLYMCVSVCTHIQIHTNTQQQRKNLKRRGEHLQGESNPVSPLCRSLGAPEQCWTQSRELWEVARDAPQMESSASRRPESLGDGVESVPRPLVCNDLVLGCLVSMSAHRMLLSVVCYLFRIFFIFNFKRAVS